MISIIALLAGMLLPALTTAKQFAETMQCTSNVRQVNQAVLAYCSDYNDRYPTTNMGWTQFNTGHTPGFPINMAKEKRLTRSMVSCVTINPYNGKRPSMDPFNNGTSIGLSNFLQSRYNWPDYIYTSVVISKIKYPSRQVAMAESCWDGNKELTAQWGRFSLCPYIIAGGGCGVISFRHNNWSTTNIGFLDGHVIQLSLGKPVFGSAADVLYTVNYFGNTWSSANNKPKMGWFKVF